MRLHLQILPPAQQKLWPLLKDIPKSFILYGGTAIALQLGHRISVDFDFFSKKELSANILQNVKRIFPNASLSVTYRSADQLNVLINDIKTTFLYYPYPVIETCGTYQNVQIATIREIAAMKAFSLGRRLSYKDYVIPIRFDRSCKKTRMGLCRQSSFYKSY